MQLLLGRVTALVALATSVACGGDGVDPSAGGVGGTYAATSLTTTTKGVTTDHLAEGARFTITLAPNGTTTGSLFVPDVAVDMAGTWLQTGGTVRFTQGAETFVRRMPFAVIGNQLRGETTLGATTLRVTLSK